MWLAATENIVPNIPVPSNLKQKRLTVCFDYFRTTTINKTLLISGYELFRAKMFPIICFWSKRQRHCVLQIKTLTLLAPFLPWSDFFLSVTVLIVKA